jgi:hypothetical protein
MARTKQAAKKLSTKGTASQLAEKTHCSEGYGLQAVRKCFAMNPALAAEGLFSPEEGVFPQAVQSCRKSLSRKTALAAEVRFSRRLNRNHPALKMPYLSG